MHRPSAPDPGDVALSTFVTADMTRRWCTRSYWQAIPDDHPGWDRLLTGMHRVTRTHGMPGHRCAICDPLNWKLGRYDPGEPS